MEISQSQQTLIKKTKILIVDDMPENLEVLGNTLREKGFQIAFATSGQRALAIAAAKLPNLILLDISMPEMDGFTICRKLKENPATKNIPVIFLTARVETDSIMKAMKTGAIDYVVKPFNSNELINRIITHLALDKADQNPFASDKKLSTSEVLSILEGELLFKWKDTRTGMFIDDVLSFADTVKTLGKNNDIKLLTDYGEDLHQHASTLKIDKMTQIFEQYPYLVQKMARAQ